MTTRRSFIGNTGLGISSLALTPFVKFNFNPYPKMDVPKYFNADFGRKLVTLLGGDPSGISGNWLIWGPLFDNYSHLKSEFELFFAKNPHGYAAYCLCFYCHSDREWGEKIIEYTKDSNSAALMVVEIGSDPEWAKRIIEETNDVHSAYLLLYNKLAERKFVEKIAEKNEKDIFPVYYLVSFHGSNKKWGEKLIEKSLDKDRDVSAYFMVKNCGSSKEWHKKVTGKEFV